MKKITFKRPIEGFNKNCNYCICIDDEKVIELKYGEEKTIEIDSKSELLAAKIHWCGSKKIKLINTANEVVFEVSGNKFLNYRLPLLGVIISPIGFVFTLDFKYEIMKHLGVGILIALLTFVIATLTIGRHKWLNIKNVN
jgi:hypothetical protein